MPRGSRAREHRDKQPESSSVEMSPKRLIRADEVAPTSVRRAKKSLREHVHLRRTVGPKQQRQRPQQALARINCRWESSQTIGANVDQPILEGTGFRAPGRAVKAISDGRRIGRLQTTTLQFQPKALADV